MAGLRRCVTRWVLVRERTLTHVSQLTCALARVRSGWLMRSGPRALWLACARAGSSALGRVRSGSRALGLARALRLGHLCVCQWGRAPPPPLLTSRTGSTQASN